MAQKLEGDFQVESNKQSIQTHIQELLTALRSEVEQEDVKILAGKFRPPTQVSEKISNPQFSDELRYLNNHWGDWNQNAPFTSHRFLVGALIARIKNKIQGYFFTVIFGDYIEQQKSFNMNLVKFCNQLSRYVDERDKQIFWETVKKLDSEVALVEERYDTLFVEVIDRVNSRN